MGFDIQRFPNCIDEELICSICGGVLQDPLQAPSCEHTFCQVNKIQFFFSCRIFFGLGLYSRMAVTIGDLSYRSNTNRTRTIESCTKDS